MQLALVISLQLPNFWELVNPRFYTANDWRLSSKSLSVLGKTMFNLLIPQSSIA